MPKKLYVGSELHVTGGAYLDSTLDVDGLTTFNDTTDASTTTNASVQMDGGVGIVKKLIVGGQTKLQANITSTDKNTGALVVELGGVGIQENLNVGNNTDDRWSAYRLVRGSTALSIGDTDGSRTTASAGSVRQTATGAQNLVSNMSVIYLDSPSTTSATTYKLSCKVQSGGAVLTFNRPGNAADADYVVHTASSITAIEVLA